MAESAFKQVHELDEIFRDEKRSEIFRVEHTDRLEKCSRDKWVPLNHVTHLPWVSRAEAISSPGNIQRIC
jgi:hypothetical protein